MALDDVLTRLADRIAGAVDHPGSAGYRRATTPWNALHAQRPAAVARVTGADDVTRSIQAASAADLRVAVQATGHGAAQTIGPGTLLLDTSALSAVTVDAERRVARAGAGATWATINALAEQHGLLGLSGTAGTVGIAGYTFGGGVGWLSRPHGLASGHLRAVDFVDAQGRVRHATDDAEDAEALWVFRGGGGVGVAIALEFGLEPAHDLWAGYMMWPVTNVERVVSAWAEALPGLHPALASAIALLRLPNDHPAVPAELRGRPIVRVAAASVAGIHGGRALHDALTKIPTAGIDTFGSCDAARLAAIHLDPPGTVAAIGEGRWLVPGPRHRRSTSSPPAGPAPTARWG